MCQDRPAIVVTEGTEVGTRGDDVYIVVASDADVEVFGQYGNDLFCVTGDAYHSATIHGGPGNDKFYVYGGSNYLTGDDNDDTFYLNAFAQDVEGNGGNDHIFGLGTLHLYADAGTGDDLVQGGLGPDELAGGSGADLVIGADGDDELDGGAGWDTLLGGLGDDNLDGGADWDKCGDSAGTPYTSCEDILESGPLPESG